MKDEYGNVRKYYKTEFLGHSYTGQFVIDGVEVGKVNEKNWSIDESLREYCYGEDNVYFAQHKLSVRIATDGKKSVKYAYTELTMGVYGFWRILNE